MRVDMVQRLESVPMTNDHTRNACRLDNMQSRSTHATAGVQAFGVRADNKAAVSFYVLSAYHGARMIHGGTCNSLEFVPMTKRLFVSFYVFTSYMMTTTQADDRRR